AHFRHAPHFQVWKSEAGFELRMNGRLHSGAEAESHIMRSLGCGLVQSQESLWNNADVMDDGSSACDHLIPPTFRREMFRSDQTSLRQQHGHERNNAGMHVKNGHRIEEAVPPGFNREPAALLRKREKPFAR